MRILNLTLILLCIIVVFGCKKENHPPVNHSADVYVLGYDGDDAAYWKNGKEIILSKTVGDMTFVTAEAHAMIIHNNDLYIVGCAYDHHVAANPILWKNGVPDTLTRLAYGTNNTRALSIAFSGNDIYIGGDFYNNIQTKGGGILWKNGIPTFVGPAVNSFSTLILSNGNIYATGSNELAQLIYPPAYYKNGITEYVNSTSVCWTHDMCISGSDMYLAGSDDYTPSYWKNGVETEIGILGDNAGEVMSMAISDKDLYMAGYSYGSVAKSVLWENNSPVFIVPNALFSRVAINNKDIYIVGNIDTTINSHTSQVATLWKNKEAMPLSANYSDAYGIYIH